MDPLHTQIITESLENQLNQRIEKLWRLFSWTSGILTSIIGAVFVLQRIENFTLDFTEQVIVSVVIVTFTTYACLMVKENLKNETKIRDQLEKIFSAKLKYSEYAELRPDKARFGFNTVLILIGASALAATWMIRTY